MNPFDQVLKRLERIRANLRPVLDRIVARELAFIEELNREQLRQGKRRDSTSLPNYVSNSRQPKAPGVIKLEDKGKYYSEIMAAIKGGILDVTNDDPKSVFLVAKYGKILGLTDQQLLRLIARIKPVYIAELKRL